MAFCLLGKGIKSCGGHIASCRPVVALKIRTHRLSALCSVPEKLDSAPTATRDEASLPFQTATERLKALLEAASWESEDDMLRAEVASLVPEMRLTLATNLGSILTLAACLTSWLTGEDPLGGFALTDDSLAAVASGAGYAVPLLLCSVASRLGAVRRSFPVLSDLHDSQEEIVRPIVEDLNSSQLLILASVLVIPAMLLLLPAAHGTLTMASALLAADLISPSLELAAGPAHAAAAGADLPLPLALPLQWHWHMPELMRRNAMALLTAVSSAYFAAWVVTRQLDVNDRQVWAIREALESADRYFLHAAAERIAARPDLLAREGPSRRGQEPPQQQLQQQPRTRLGEAASGRLAVTSFAAVGGEGATGAADDGGGGEGPSGPLRQLSAEMAQAFKMVSIVWMLTRRRAARLGYVLTALNVSYFGVIWHHTHDLGTPVTAALLATLAELLLIKHFPRGRAHHY